jgi:hypothetical protein
MWPMSYSSRGIDLQENPRVVLAVKIGTVQAEKIRAGRGTVDAPDCVAYVIRYQNSAMTKGDSNGQTAGRSIALMSGYLDDPSVACVHHASILTRMLLSYPVPCSQNLIGSPAWAWP